MSVFGLVFFCHFSQLETGTGYGSGLRVGDSTAPAARAGCLRQLGPKVKKYMYGGILVACYSKRCIFITCFCIWQRYVLASGRGLLWYMRVICKLAVARLKLGLLRRPLRGPAADAARNLNKGVYVWRYLSSLLFYAVYVYGLFRGLS